MAGILIVTHGDFGAYLLEAAEEIVGRAPSLQVQALSISRRIPLAEVRIKIEKAIRSMYEDPQTGGIVVLCDMLGGTPCNETLLLSKNLDSVEIVTGVNLYMVISALMNAQKMTARPLAQKIMEDGKRSVVNARELLRSSIHRPINQG